MSLARVTLVGAVAALYAIRSQVSNGTGDLALAPIRDTLADLPESESALDLDTIAITHLRDKGYAVCVFTPEDFATPADLGEVRKHLEDVLSTRGNEYIADMGLAPNDEDDEEENPETPKSMYWLDEDPYRCLSDRWGEPLVGQPGDAPLSADDLAAIERLSDRLADECSFVVQDKASGAYGVLVECEMKGGYVPDFKHEQAVAKLIALFKDQGVVGGLVQGPFIFDDRCAERAFVPETAGHEIASSLGDSFRRL